MYRQRMLSLAISGVFVLGTALAQLDTMTEVVTSLEHIGQDTTDVDTSGDIASGLDLAASAIVLLSGESGQITDALLPTGEVVSGTIPNQNSDPIPRLLISEVYYDGTDEWFEITNIGQGNFQGTISLVGVKSTPLTISNILILSGDSKIFGDILSQISGTQWIEKTGLALNITDTTAINIQLSISGQIEDRFLVDEYRVNKYNDKKTSFEKIGNIPTRVENPINNQSGYIITPGRYLHNGNPRDVSFPPQQSSGDLQLPLPCILVDQRELAKINEIFPGNEKYPSYIELSIDDDITIDSLSLSGDYLSTGIEFLGDMTKITLEKNTLLLLSSTGFRQTQGVASLQNSGLNQLGTGHWLVITFGSGQSRRVMDIGYISGDTLGKSYYFAKTSQQCARIFDAVDDFSPGFEQKFLKFFSGTTITKIEYIQATTGSQDTPASCQSSGQISGFSGETVNATNSSGIINNYTIRILSVDYDPEGSDTNNEKVTLLATSKLGWSNPLDLNSIFRLKVNGTNKTLPRSLPMDIPTTFSKTFGFPNSSDGQDVLIQLTYGDYVFATYTYNPNKPEIDAEKKIETGDTELSGTVFSLSGLSFSITYVLPNPKGSDKAEEIGLAIYPNLTALGGEATRQQLDLRQGFSLKIGSHTKKLQGTGYIGQENILSGSLGLVNKAACVVLLYKEQELTKFCYGNLKEGQKLYASAQGLEKTSEENLSILNTLQIKKIGTDLCVLYSGTSFVCKHIPAGKAAIKTIQEQKMYKGFTSLIKQYLMSNWKDLYYNTPIKQYYDLVAKNKKLIASGVAYVDIYGQSIKVTDIKKQLQVQETTLPGVIAVFVGIQAMYP